MVADDVLVESANIKVESLLDEGTALGFLRIERVILGVFHHQIRHDRPATIRMKCTFLILRVSSIYSPPPAATLFSRLYIGVYICLMLHTYLSHKIKPLSSMVGIVC